MGEQLTPIPAVAQLIKQYATEGMVVCEVGVFHGHTMASYLPIVRNLHGQIIAVDWFKGNKSVVYHFAKTPGAYATDKDYEDIFWSIVGKENADIVKVMKMDSLKALIQLPENSIDFMFIDADHAYSSVVKEIALGLKVVKNGGIISGHDCESKVNEHYLRILAAQQREQPNPPSLQGQTKELSIWEFDCWGGFHHGVIKAVNEHFGTDFEQANNYCLV